MKLLRRMGLVVLAASAGFPAAAQERVDSVMVERIPQEGLDRSQALTLFKIGSTDHLSFIAAGVPAFTLKDYADYDVRTRHTNADFFERVRERDLQQPAIVLAAFAYHAAMRDGPLPRGPARPATPEGGAR